MRNEIDYSHFSFIFTFAYGIRRKEIIEFY